MQRDYEVLHLEKGNLMSADAYLDEQNVNYAREILKKLIHPDDRIVVLTTSCALNRENDRNECEFRAADGKGGYRRLHALQQCLRSADGSHFLLQITLTDTTLQYQIIEQRRTWHE